MKKITIIASSLFLLLTNIAYASHPAYQPSFMEMIGPYILKIIPILLLSLPVFVISIISLLFTKDENKRKKMKGVAKISIIIFILTILLWTIISVTAVTFGGPGEY